MNPDPVPSLLGRATEVLEAEFASLPGYVPATAYAEEATAAERKARVWHDKADAALELIRIENEN